MLVLVHKAHATLLPWAGPHVGRLLSPRHFARAHESAAVFPTAADNDCFQRLDAPAFRSMLAALVGAPLLFIAVPDVVADARATLRRFARWRDRVAQVGPVALCAQDGLVEPPWDELDALFIGGSSQWKCSAAAYVLVREARERGVWVHMGRVNTGQRMRLAKSWGVDSIDGTSVSRFTTRRLPERLVEAAAPRQLTTMEVAL